VKKIEAPNSDSFRRLDDLAGIEAQILAEARCQNLDSGPQGPVSAHRHGEGRKAEQRRGQADADRIQHPGGPLARRIEIVRQCQFAKGRHHHKRIALHEFKPAPEKEVALRQRAEHPAQICRRHKLVPETHRSLRIRVAVLRHLRRE